LHNLLNRQNYHCQLLIVCGVNGVRQIEMHTAELLVPEPYCFKVAIAIETL